MSFCFAESGPERTSLYFSRDKLLVLSTSISPASVYTEICSCRSKWTRADSNRLPPQCKWGVLPGELRARLPALNRVCMSNSKCQETNLSAQYAQKGAKLKNFQHELISFRKKRQLPRTEVYQPLNLRVNYCTVSDCCWTYYSITNLPDFCGLR